MAIPVAPGIELADGEVRIRFVRSQGAGGQHVNKVATAAVLSFDIPASSLPDDIKSRLLGANDRRISRDGVLTLKAQRARSQERNRDAVLARLAAIVTAAAEPPRPRKATRVPAAEKRRRREAKQRRSTTKRRRTTPARDD
ncbi:MAG: alternative ribosome rescue aminoacyl-tRNA hydrolase ArfB [Pseudomonadota bacterium]